MSAVPMNFALRRKARGPNALLQPLDEWSRARTATVALALALLTGTVGACAWRVADASGLDAARAEWTAAKTRAHEVERIVRGLPVLKARVVAARLEPAQWSAADTLRAVADLAAQSGLRDTSVEPAAKTRAVPDTPQASRERVLKLRAEGAFGEIRRFLEALAGLPRLVVPEGVQLRRQAGMLTLEASVRVFEDQPAIPLAIAAPRATSFIIDPFGGADSVAQGGDILLVGTFVGARRAMALLQSGHDVGGFAQGQRIGAERIERVVPRMVELAPDRGPARKLTLAEDRK